MSSELLPDLERIRADFPFLEVEIAGQPVAYLDNGASTQKPRAVIARMAEVAAHEYANVHRGIHLLSQRASELYEAARVRAAAFFGAARPEDVVFTRGTTEALNIVAGAWGEAHVQAGDTILLTELEHHANLVPWLELARRKGARVEYVPILPNGAGLDPEAARRLLAARPRVFAFAHVSNTLGVTNPVAEWCALAREIGVTTVVDGAQSAGHLPVDVTALGCDFFACSAHKFAGPSGIGLLIGRAEALAATPPWLYGGDMVERVTYTGATYRDAPGRFEAGTPAIIEAAGLHAALDYLDTLDLPRIAAHADALAEQAAAGLRVIPGVRVFGPEGRRAGLVTFHVEDVHAHDIAFACDERGVAVRAGHHCAQPLMRKLGAPSSCRMSFYLYNTGDEVIRGLAAVQAALAFFRRA